MAKKEKTKTKKTWNLFKEFKNFISRGSILDMAVGVIIGNAFSAIVTALVNILLSLCTWAVPGGLTGLVTVLPALNDTQRGVEGIGQSFAASDIVEATINYAASQGVTITADSDTFITWQTSLKGLYTLHGNVWTYNASAVIDWGTFINAIISFLIIALTLFIIVKVSTSLKKMREKAKLEAQEKYYELHPEERPKPEEPQPPKPTEVELLQKISTQLENLKSDSK